MNDRPDNSARNRLFVEGADDFHVVCALVRKAGVAWTKSNPQIPYAPQSNGDEDALKQARLAVRARSHPCVGLILDADDDPALRWTSVLKRLEALAPLGIALPATYPDDGAVVSDKDGRRLGVWMMPGRNQRGAVEGFLASLVPQAGLWPHAVEATDTARAKGAVFADKDLLKARLRAWLAWQASPGAPYEDGPSMPAISRTRRPRRTPSCPGSVGSSACNVENRDSVGDGVPRAV